MTLIEMKNRSIMEERLVVNDRMATTVLIIEIGGGLVSGGQWCR